MLDYQDEIGTDDLSRIEVDQLRRQAGQQVEDSVAVV